MLEDDIDPLFGEKLTEQTTEFFFGRLGGSVDHELLSLCDPTARIWLEEDRSGFLSGDGVVRDM